MGATFTTHFNSFAIEWPEGGHAKHFGRRKHIDINFNYVMDLIEEGEIELYKLDTGDMIADYLTKPPAPKDLGSATTCAKMLSVRLILLNLVERKNGY